MVLILIRIQFIVPIKIFGRIRFLIDLTEYT